jgi:hypothetical protein
MSCFLVSGYVGAKEKIVFYHRNFDNPFLHKSLKNFADLSKDDFGDYELVKSKDMEQGRAFAELVKGNIDVLITAPTEQREKQAKAIYVPLDRGLLGFRICMINKEQNQFGAIQSANQFISKQLSVGLGAHWPDRAIFEDNGFNVITSPVHKSLYSMLASKRFDCLTRSINEINNEVDQYSDMGLAADHELVFIYANADFIFINPKNKKLHQRLSTGVGYAIENNSFYEIFDEFYENELSKHRIYERKLVFLDNNKVSHKALSAINRFGIASFVTSPLKNKKEKGVPLNETGD